MGRATGLGGMIEGITGEGGTLTGRGRGIPMPMVPTENIGMMSGAIRKKRGSRRRDERGSRRSEGGKTIAAQVTMKDPKTGRLYGGLVKDGIPQFEKPDFVSKEDFNKSFPKLDSRVVDKIPGLTPITPKPTFDPSKPSAVMETERVNVQDPTLGGPPEREVPIPKERDTSPRGPAPFSPDERAMARDAFFEKMFSRADERKQSRAMDQEERRNVMDARRDEAAMRGSERGMRNEGGGRRRREIERDEA